MICKAGLSEIVGLLAFTAAYDGLEVSVTVFESSELKGESDVIRGLCAALEPYGRRCGIHGGAALASEISAKWVWAVLRSGIWRLVPFTVVQSGVE